PSAVFFPEILISRQVFTGIRITVITYRACPNPEQTNKVIYPVHIIEVLGILKLFLHINKAVIGNSVPVIWRHSPFLPKCKIHIGRSACRKVCYEIILVSPYIGTFTRDKERQITHQQHPFFICELLNFLHLFSKLPLHPVMEIQFLPVLLFNFTYRICAAEFQFFFPFLPARALGPFFYYFEQSIILQPVAVL